MVLIFSLSSCSIVLLFNSVVLFQSRSGISETTNTSTRGRVIKVRREQKTMKLKRETSVRGSLFAHSAQSIPDLPNGKANRANVHTNRRPKSRREMKDRFADYAPMSQEVIHPLEKEKLVYHIKHLGYKEPDLPKKPDFICQYENMFRRNQTSDHDIHNDMSVQDHGCNSAQSVTHPDYPQCLNYPSDKADERTPMSKKRKLLDSFNTFSGGPQGHTESHSIPRPQPTIPPLKLKISLKKKEHDSPNTGKVQPDTPKKEYPKSTVSLDATTIQKLKILMNPKSPSKNPPQLTTDSTPASCVDPQQPRGTNNAEIPMPPSSRALTSAQVRSILAIDDIVDVSQLANSDAWVRRSTRQPSRSSITSNHVQTLVEKLRMNDPDVVVLKMKQYLSDPNTPSVILDTVLDALEENTNCQALYIQVRNEIIYYIHQDYMAHYCIF
jgi:hypothetical protein